MNWESERINIDGEYLNNLRYVDDIVLIADDLKEAKGILEELIAVTEKVGLEITEKTKMNKNPMTTLRLD